ncbi:MAG: hypothetical protein K0S18_2134 [Anaerocolumna sp.]|nr:hypothetical protein [Anaerocolumna sp.]
MNFGIERRIVMSNEFGFDNLNNNENETESLSTSGTIIKMMQNKKMQNKKMQNKKMFGTIPVEPMITSQTTIITNIVGMLPLPQIV